MRAWWIFGGVILAGIAFALLVSAWQIRHTQRRQAAYYVGFLAFSLVVYAINPQTFVAMTGWTLGLGAVEDMIQQRRTRRAKQLEDAVRAVLRKQEAQP